MDCSRWRWLSIHWRLGSWQTTRSWNHANVRLFFLTTFFSVILEHPACLIYWFWSSKKNFNFLISLDWKTAPGIVENGVKTPLTVEARYSGAMETEDMKASLITVKNMGMELNGGKMEQKNTRAHSWMTTELKASHSKTTVKLSTMKAIILI